MNTYLLGSGVRNLLLVNPISRPLVLNIINFLGGVDSGFKVLEEATSLVTLAVNQNVIGVIRTMKSNETWRILENTFDLLDNKSIKVSELFNSGFGGQFEVLLLKFASLWALMPEDEVHLVTR